MTLFLAFFLFAQLPPLTAPKSGPQISVHNSILVQINEKNISVVDVMKKMEIAFHQQYPHLANSAEARYQYYDTSWRRILREMVQQELVLTEAARREIEVTDGEVREEMESRFGPNIMRTLDQLNLPFEEAWDFVKNDLLFHRMTGYFVYMRALQGVTPQEIRKAYRLYLNDHPAYREWKYQVLSMSNATPETMEKLHDFLAANNGPPEEKRLLETFPSLQISAEYVTADTDLSESYQKTLSPLTPNSYSEPLLTSGRGRIFYLHDSTDHTPPPFETMENKLRDAILQGLLGQESNKYFAQLSQRFGFDMGKLDRDFPESLHPFSLEW